MTHRDKEIVASNSPILRLHIERLLQIRAFYIQIKGFIDSIDQKVTEKYDEEAIKAARIKGNEEVLASDFKPFFMSLLFIQIRTILEIYFNEILEYIYINKIDILKNSNKKYSTEEILSFEHMERLHSYLAINEIKKFNENNSKNKIEYLKTFLNKDDILTETLISKFIEISEIRNLLVHNEGRINDRFDKLVNNPKYNRIIKIEIDEGRLLEAIDSMISFISELDKEICNKFGLTIDGFK